MAIVAKVIGTLFVLMGIVWILQGINVLPGSFMTGQMQWAIYGVIMVLAGIGMFAASRRMGVKR
jgi:hypothetical protein